MIRQEILKTSKEFLYHGATDISDVILNCSLAVTTHHPKRVGMEPGQ